MNALTMDYQLTIPAIFRRTELFATTEVVTRLPDKSLHRYCYGDFADRARRLAAALQQLGVRNGDRVATLCWNHRQHLEAYFAIALAGGVLHTLNLRLHPDDLAYIVHHARDRIIIIDASLVPLLEKFRGRIPPAQVIVIGEGGPVPPDCLDYEALLEGARSVILREASPDERDAAAMCYTTGTTGRPKGVVYSHRAVALHTMGFGVLFGINDSDTFLPVVPMFHANAWGMPFCGVMLGTKMVFPGPHPDAVSLLELLSSERVTLTAGVPTIWMGLLQVLDKSPGAYDLSRLRTMVVGGSAVPAHLIRAFEERHALRIIQAWGMTEMAPLGTVSRLPPEVSSEPKDVQYGYRAKQGRPAPFIEIRARGEQGLVPWDGKTMGELEIRGAWVASGYYHQDPGDRFTEDGWFRSGDIVTIDSRGCIEIQDRATDLIKSGGEWISSVALENAIMGHPAVAEAAVVAVPHPRWQERPLAAVVLKEGQTATVDEIKAFLAPLFASWWLPEAIEFVPSIPRSSAGKFLKTALREQFKSYWQAT